MEKKKFEQPKVIRPEQQVKYPNPNPGVEVAPGENFASLSPEQREAYFRNFEQTAKARANANRSSFTKFSRG